MDEPVVPDGPDFKKSLDIDHARDGEVIIAYAMNGQQLPLLHGFPLRLVVPGWYATYWVKTLNDIEVLDQPDDNFWMKTAYTIPDTPYADMKPGQTGVKMVPINKMVPRSFVTNIKSGQTITASDPTLVEVSRSAVIPASRGSICPAMVERIGSRRCSAMMRASSVFVSGSHR